MSEIGNGVLTVLCRKCRYDLRGIPMDGHCPECGTTVEFSFRDGLLCHAYPAWVSTLRLGARLIFWSMVALILTGITISPHGGTDDARVLFTIAATVLYAVGAWAVTEPDPSGLGEDLYGGPRRLVRWTLAFGVVDGFCEAVRWVGPPPHVLHRGTAVVAVVASAGDRIGTFAMLAYISRLAPRIPAQDLARRAGQLFYWLGVPLAGAEVLGDVRDDLHLSASTSNLLNLCTAVLVAPLIVTGPMYLFLLRRLAKRLGEHAAVAHRLWSEVERARHTW